MLVSFIVYPWDTTYEAETLITPADIGDVYPSIIMDYLSVF